jgi:hypothetical protein
VDQTRRTSRSRLNPVDVGGIASIVYCKSGLRPMDVSTVKGKCENNY